MGWTCSCNGAVDEECTQKSDGETSAPFSTWRSEKALGGGGKNMIKMDVVGVVSDDGR
jgi:hypothetical protein